jgi:hypothetical protein
MTSIKKPLDILKKEGNKAATEVALMAISDNNILSQVIQGSVSSNKRIKNAAIKSLRTISEISPQKLYSRFDFFIDLINGDDTILKWNAIDITGNLSYVDSDSKINKKILGLYFKLLEDPVMITAAHSIDNLWKIAVNKSDLREIITQKLLTADKIERNQECQRILAGKIILSVSNYFEQIENREQVINFVRSHLNNKRNATRKKAQNFLKKFV